jgi:hypothetical protein
MNMHEEMLFRLALKRRRKLDNLSDEGFHELELAVREDPKRFVDDAEEEAFSRLFALLVDYDAKRERIGLVESDSEFQEACRRHDKEVAEAAAEILKIDGGCVDAHLVQIACGSKDADDRLSRLLDLEHSLEDQLGPIVVGPTGDAYADVFSRPRLRVLFAVAQGAMLTGRFRTSIRYCEELLEKAPLDAMGARLTMALALARLEDEDGFNALAARDAHGNAWLHLGRVILAYKLGRLSATRRALMGFDRLCTGGAYAFLQPHYMGTYLLDRPVYTPGSFEETVLAIHEAEPILLDTPELCNFASKQSEFLASARAFCKRNGLDWHDWGNWGNWGYWGNNAAW